MLRCAYRIFFVLFLGLLLFAGGCSKKPSPPQPPTNDEIADMISEETPMLQSGGEMNTVREFYTVDVLEVHDKSLNPSQYFNTTSVYIGKLSPHYKSKDLGPILLKGSDRNDFSIFDDYETNPDIHYLFVRCSVTGRTQSKMAAFSFNMIGAALDASKQQLANQGVPANLLEGGSGTMEEPDYDTGILQEPVNMWFALLYFPGDANSAQEEGWKMFRFMGIEEDGDRIFLE